jgi:hypothetical protein
MENTQLPRFNDKWRDPECEELDCIHLPDAVWRRDANYCNPSWGALPALGAKLHQSRATSTVIAPYSPHKPLFQ